MLIHPSPRCSEASEAKSETRRHCGPTDEREGVTNQLSNIQTNAEWELVDGDALQLFACPLCAALVTEDGKASHTSTHTPARVGAPNPNSKAAIFC